ncbi:MAG TPA: signal peptidase II [Terriglobales bacterium]|nr:signal peptidase II [Terriglobales bacterium]
MNLPIPGRRDYREVYFFLAATVLILDQVTKLIVAKTIPLYGAVTVIPGFFQISHVLNRGAAFSLFAEVRNPLAPIGLLLFSLIVMTVIIVILVKSKGAMTRTNVGLSLILGGALGNFLDRLLMGSVVDFLAFHVGSYHWPDFNLADSAILAGSGLLLLDVFFHTKETVSSQPATDD